MTESAKTITFAAVAAALVGFSTISHFANKPSNSADFELVGKPFFEEFESAEQAQSLEVVAVDKESVKTQRFAVENKDGLWRIPSHYNYPAEAAARLATTASSVIGINRDSMAGRLEQEHEKFGVVDPLGEEIEDPDAVGKRITLKDSDGDTLVDYIIGKEAGEIVRDGVDAPFGDQVTNEKYYYVRRPDEQQTYKVKLDVDLSAKFSDWIDPDLLRLERNELIRILIDNYKLEEDRNTRGALFKAQGDKLHITRKNGTDPWVLAELNTELEELNTNRVNEVIGVLDEMKIAGVRPKYKYKDHLLLTADLKLNDQPEFKQNPQEFGRAIQRLQAELDQKGFNLAGSAQKMELVSQQGELQLGTNQGVVYTLHVGSALEGSEEEIEIGLESSSKNASSSPTNTESDPEESDSNKSDKNSTEEGDSEKNPADEAKNDSDEESDPLADARNRYLMVRVSFDETLLGEKPTKPTAPVEPIKPENYIDPPKEESEDKKDEDKPAAPEDVAAPDAENDEDKKAEADQPERNPESIQYDEDRKKYIDGKMEYEIALSKFEDDLKAYEKKIEDGKLAVEELNERFGDWYYVISANNLKTLQTTRDDLATKKDVPEGQKVEGLPGRPNISFPDVPGVGAEMKPAGESPKETKSDETKSEEPGAEDKRAEPKKTEVNQKSEDAATEKPEQANDNPKGETKASESKSEEPPKSEQPLKTDDPPKSESTDKDPDVNSEGNKESGDSKTGPETGKKESPQFPT